jgi:hypothetical protein
MNVSVRIGNGRRKNPVVRAYAEKPLAARIASVRGKSKQSLQK